MTKKLLLADDSITIQKVIGIIFATEDYQLLVTDNGDEAYDKALEERPDLVIADISMPGKDGFELCQLIKSESSLSNTAVLLLPGTFDHFDEERAQEVAADGWLTKPFESQALLDKVSQLLAAEPLRLAGAAVDAPPEEAAEVDELDVAFAAPAVEEDEEPLAAATLDETVLGLDQMTEPTAGDDTFADSPEDIWDAVSFEEDDLEEQVEGLEADPELDEVSFADLAAAEKIAEEASDDEDVLDLSAADEVVEESGFVAFADAPAELAEELTINEPVAETVEAAGEDDEILELDVEVSDVAAEVIPLAGDEVEPLDLTGAADDEDVEIFESFTAESAAEEVSDAEPVLTELSIDEECSAAGADDVFTVEEQPAEMAEEIPVVEPLDEELIGEGEEILDLADEDILEEGPGFAAAEEVLHGEEVLEPEPVAFGGGLEFEAVEPLETEIETEEAVSSMEDSAAAPLAEDEGFYFDASEVEEPDSADQPVAAVAAAAIVADEGTAGAVEQAEQQLRQLSEEELKEVVAKVAGPIIEKLASEMLEQIAWEVVPDLAESMIREEIRKIQQVDE